MKIFGEEATNIEEGDLFRAIVKYIEGRKVVTLESTSLELEEEYRNANR
jgi:hypothetical protein